MNWAEKGLVGEWTALACARWPERDTWQLAEDCAIVPPMTKSCAMLRRGGLDCSKIMRLRRAPKVTVTRGWVSLCQKGVTSWLLFVLTISWLGSELKRAGGRAACSIARAPLRSKSDGALLEGGPGGGLSAELFTMVFSAALNWLLLPIVLIVASAHRRDLLHASGHDLFQGKGI